MKTLLAYAQLLRLPNALTVIADGLLALGSAGVLLAQPGPSAFALAAGVSLYLAGMAFNDVFDRHDDAKHRRFRPIPSGRVSVRSAVILGIVLLLAGLGCGVAASAGAFVPLLWLGCLTASILAYDGGMKSTPFGPIVMGSCRFFHLLFGLTLGTELPTEVVVHLAAIIGIYIVGVTWFARTEELSGPKWELKPAAGVLVLALGLALLLPLHETFAQAYRLFPYLLFGYGAILSGPVLRAIRDPRPMHVQAAVKRTILGLIALDAILLALTLGWPAAALVLLYLPARLLGRWVYST